MVNRIFVIAVVIIGLAAAGVGQAPCTRYVAAAFSMCQPAGWTVDADDGSAFKSLSGKNSIGKNANVNFTEVDSDKDLSDFVDDSNKYTLEHFAEGGLSSIKLAGRSAIVTDSNEKGIKTTFLEEAQGHKLIGAQYVFADGKKKLFVTFTSLDPQADADERLFDATIKTLVIGPAAH